MLLLKNKPLKAENVSYVIKKRKFFLKKLAFCLKIRIISAPCFCLDFPAKQVGLKKARRGRI